MKGDPKVIEYLQKGLRSELTAINQYLLHSRLLEDWGIEKLAKLEEDEAADERQHADRFIKRMLFLDAMPDLQQLDPLRIGGNVREILENDRAAEKDALDLYREAVAACEQAQDYASRDLFVELIADEEGHYDFLDTQLDLMDNMGHAQYLQTQAGDAGASELEGEDE